LFGCLYQHWSSNCIVYHAKEHCHAVNDGVSCMFPHYLWPSTSWNIKNAALRTKSLPTPGLVIKTFIVIGDWLHAFYEECFHFYFYVIINPGYQSAKDAWIAKDYGYETTELERDAEQLINQIQPFYKLIHAFVRRKLYEKYGPEKIDLRGPIPAHLLGTPYKLDILWL
jgi:hypothetical protein